MHLLSQELAFNRLLITTFWIITSHCLWICGLYCTAFRVLGVHYDAHTDLNINNVVMSGRVLMNYWVVKD